MSEPGLEIRCDKATGLVSSVRLYGNEMLDPERPCGPELLLNGLPLKTRLYPGRGGYEAPERLARLKGEKFVDHYSGAGLVLVRSMGERYNMKYRCLGVHYLIRRELADADDLPCPGPGGPVVEAPLYVDTFTLLNWNWRFWGEDTRMMFPSCHSTGPADEFGHAGYEHDTPERCKQFMRNVWRRVYPGVMAIHGGVFYNARTGHWLAITCRRPNVGYILNIESAGRGVSYDFTLHSRFDLGNDLQMPEIKIYYGKTREEMMSFIGDYLTFYYQEPPEWAFKTLWGDGLAWNNRPTWTEQADFWEERLASGEITGIGYSLVTNRPVMSGTTPIGYEPDPNHGTLEEFRRMCRRVTDEGVPLLIWMSHSGLLPGARDIDDDWFIRGIDGRSFASWGSVDGGMSVCNPGHPGYIEYTKRWIRFYIRECGCKGIFFDCLGMPFPPDFAPRSFMRRPGDTNLTVLRFMEEVHACIKECDPEAIMLGEGTTLDAPVDIFSVHSNPIRAIDGLGPRDFFLQVRQHAAKRIVIDQGPRFCPSSGMTRALSDEVPGAGAKNRYLARLLAEKGGRSTFIHLPGDLSITESENLLVVPQLEDKSTYPELRLPANWSDVAGIVEETDGTTVKADPGGVFRNVVPGIYRLPGRQ
jgi:hypothetical protein